MPMMPQKPRKEEPPPPPADRFDLDAQLYRALKPKNAMMNNHRFQGDDDGVVNSMMSFAGVPSGTREHIKAYTHQFGFDEGDYTENSLSPEGVAYLRKLAEMNHGRVNALETPTLYPKPDSVGMMSTLGRVAPQNFRKVVIGGVPYWQVLDRYNFNNEEEDLANGKKNEMVNHLMREGLTDYRSKKIIPSLLGLRYNSNFLVPVDPRHQAHPDLIEAHRKATSLGNNPAFPTSTLGGRAKRFIEQTVMPTTPFGGVAE